MPSANKHQPIVWSIAGSDCSAGAGIQADNQVFSCLHVQFGNIITAVTAQNSRSVQHISQTTLASFDAQWQSLADELPADVIKIGMLGSEKLLQRLTQKLATFSGKVVCDPVMASTSGGSLIDDASGFQSILPYIDVLTPNRHEFEQLFAKDIEALGFDKAALAISKRYQLALLITGGDSCGSPFATDVFVHQNTVQTLSSPFVSTPHTHGTGCSLSSAIAAFLALAYSPPDAVVLAKAYINQGLMLPAVSLQNPAAFQHTHFPDGLKAFPFFGKAKQAFSFKTLDRPLGLYALVNSIESLKKALDLGVDTLQLRVKGVTPIKTDQLVEEAVALANAQNIPLFINDEWRLAIKHKAFGVHLGQEDLVSADLAAIHAAGLHLGLSTHNWYEIAKAHAHAPSYIAFGPIFETQSKAIAHHTIAINTLQAWVSLLQNHYQLTAIGGIDTSNVERVASSGIRSVAVISAIGKSADPQAAVDQLQAALTDHK